MSPSPRPTPQLIDFEDVTESGRDKEAMLRALFKNQQVTLQEVIVVSNEIESYRVNLSELARTVQQSMREDRDAWKAALAEERRNHEAALKVEREERDLLNRRLTEIENLRIQASGAVMLLQVAIAGLFAIPTIATILSLFAWVLYKLQALGFGSAP